MKFKNYEEYMKMRNGILDEAQALLTEGKLDEANAKSKEVEELDNEWENFSKAQANLNAMMGKRPEHAPGIVGMEPNVLGEDDSKSNTYKKAFANYMMGKTLSAEERKAFENVNPGFSNAANNAEEHTVLIPETVKDGIWQEIGETHPIFGDAVPTFIKGDITIIKDESEDGDAEWYKESETVKEDELKHGEMNLSGCELAKDITVSWKMKKMSIDAFLTYITGRLAKKMGNALAKAIVNGKGKPSNEETFKQQPRGIVTVLEKSRNQVKEFTEGMTYDDVVDAFAMIKSGYKKVCYATSQTIWGEIAKIKDTTGRPLFIPDVTSGGVGHLFGAVVKEEDSVEDGSLLVGDVEKGYAININEDVTMYSEDHVKARTTDYMTYALVDGDVLTEKAFALLKKVAAKLSLSATIFSKSAAEDISVTVTGKEGMTISKLLLAGTEVAKSSGANWSVSGNVVTIKKEYLTTLEAGAQKFTITFNNGTSKDFEITVVA